jgi:26S proteasome non-ATPase regulatory subunit 10
MSIESSDIQRAVADGNVGIVKALLAKDPQLALTKDADERTPLHWAVSFQNKELVEVLLDPSQCVSDELGNVKNQKKKIVVDLDDFTDEAGWTPLHIAASAGDFDIFRMLALHEPRADVNEQTSTGQTCLHYAVSKNHFLIVDFLITELKASVRTKDKKGQLPLHRAAAIGSSRMVQTLIEEGKSPLNATDAFGMTAIHHALAEGHADVALQLVKYGADWRTTTTAAGSVFDVALNDQVRLFFKRGLVADGELEPESE